MMSERRSGCGQGHGGLRSRTALAAVLLATAWLATLAPSPAKAAIGYEPHATTPEVPLGERIPHGIAVDQASRRVYVAAAFGDTSGSPGDVSRFESDLSPLGTLSVGNNAHYSGVAVDPLTQDLYAAQARLRTPFGTFGIPQMDVFSSSGVLQASFALTETETLPQIATDSAGAIYYPNAATDSVQVFDESGAALGEIFCADCPGGGFGQPVSIALDSEDDLYVADLSPDRVVKLTLSEGSYVFASLLQTGRGAAAVAVDPGTDDVLVGDMPNGRDFHIVAYDSSGTQFDDFGAGMFTDPSPSVGAVLAAQIAADATSHNLYVGELGKFYVFEKTTIPPPTATAEPATAVGQLTATLRATVNANGHATLECQFEYTDDADFQANEFANATALPCSKLPNGSKDTALSHALGGLTPATLYRYRIDTASYAGATTSGAQSFETLPELPPAIAAEAPTAVGETSATLKATVNPRGGSVSDCHFELGESTSYGTDLPCASLPGPVNGGVAQSRSVSGLAPGSSHHYRLVVTSNAGTTEGEDVEFRTDDPPPPPPPPPAPAPTPTPETVEPPPIVSATPPLRCRRGFRKRRVRGKVRCVRICPRGYRPRRVRNRRARRRIRCVRVCPRGFRKKRVRVRVGRRVRTKIRCVRKRGNRAARRQRARARRR